MTLDLSRYDVVTREGIIMRHVQNEGPILQAVFYRDMVLEDPATSLNLPLADRRLLWPSVYTCLFECVYRALEAKGFKLHRDAWPLLCSAAFLLSVHNLLGYDLIPTMPTVRVINRHGMYADQKVDYLIVQLVQAFEERFTPQALHDAMYEVYALTGWMGCPKIEQQGLRQDVLQERKREAERYRDEGRADRRAAMERNAAAGEWKALRRIEMGGRHRTRSKPRRHRTKTARRTGMRVKVVQRTVRGPKAL